MKNFFLNRQELKEKKNSEDVPIIPVKDEIIITWHPSILIPSNIGISMPSITPPIIIIP
jgi:hypothetical protein